MKNPKPFNASASHFPLIPLESVSVASPCSADWDAMQGDDQSRFCKACAKNVYNLSAMTRAEAESLIQAKEGHLCIRYYRRADGTILTQDCPVGLLAASPQLRGKFKLWGETANLFMLCGALIAGLVTLPVLLNAAEKHRKTTNYAKMGEMPVVAVAGGISAPPPQPTAAPTPSPILGRPAMGKPQVTMGAPVAIKPTKQKCEKPAKAKAKTSKGSSGNRS